MADYGALCIFVGPLLVKSCELTPSPSDLRMYARQRARNTLDEVPLG